MKPFRLQAEVSVNNSWSDRHTVIEGDGPLTGRGCSTDLTTTISRLNLNIASAHVATFGERAVDVFYVTDLMGRQTSFPPQRQASIKRALLGVFEREALDEAPRKVAAR